MKIKIYITWLCGTLFLLAVAGLISNALAFEIITKDDIKKGIIVNIDLLKTADNAILLFGSSSTMNKPYKDTGMSRYDIGSEDYNLDLSYKRVESIASYLVENFNVNRSQLVTFWFGKLNPVADNSSSEGRMQNRRVEILIGGI